ncbi:MBL fold metallo-hydrolase [Alteromonas lipolytica]|uniref:MBL fold metallo-hydrolase n=1 Tax=Alteromonas lipolytica TaxID=1856405 RepID=A0A1E8FBC7_9ALTE|nr:MBL fold metallo-hydrolase [Alteromonas lipolytica]OFI32803.1 MBL fold metallo-hydrolase [Alteromonas lipolytica]GGF72854.1 MBL fold metallo-hydrolase [Alteromonas lipolytica]
MNKLATLIATSLLSVSAVAGDLTFKVYNAGEGSFGVNSTLVYGDTEALIVDSGFTKADALRIAANVYDSGKTLTTIFVSQADPDYYFGAEELHKLFPDAKIIATPAVSNAIKNNRQKKVAIWGPEMGGNAPQQPVIPEAYAQSTISVDGHPIEIHSSTGVLATRPYLWAPQSKTILGNVAVFGGMHLWLADTKTEQQQAAWIAQLNEMKALQPKQVIPGHMAEGTPMDASAINYSIRYLTVFGDAADDSVNSAELISKVEKTFPALPSESSLELAAKVVKGEIQW